MVAMVLHTEKTADEVVLESHSLFRYTTFSSCVKWPLVQFHSDHLSVLIASLLYVSSLAAASPPVSKRQIRRHHLLSGVFAEVHPVKMHPLVRKKLNNS
jgi:hypothetical protein